MPEPFRTDLWIEYVEGEVLKESICIWERDGGQEIGHLLNLSTPNSTVERSRQRRWRHGPRVETKEMALLWWQHHSRGDKTLEACSHSLGLCSSSFSILLSLPPTHVPNIFLSTFSQSSSTPSIFFGARTHICSSTVKESCITHNNREKKFSTNSHTIRKFVPELEKGSQKMKTAGRRSSHWYTGWSKISVHLMTTIQKVTSNVQSVPLLVSRHLLTRRAVFSKTVFSIARSTFRMNSVMAIFNSSIVWGL